MKVLISAYSCAPGFGSEPGAGWAWAYAATRDHEVWLITHSANATVIEPARRTDPTLAVRLHPVYVHIGHRAERLRRLGPLRFLYYLLWQSVSCRRAARALHASIGFDVAHHVTYASDWMPAGVASVPGLPFVWGPVGGSSTHANLRLLRLLGLRSFVTEIIRLSILVPLRLTVGRGLARRATVVLGQNADVADAFPTARVIVEPHVAVENEPVTPRTPSAEDSPVAVFAGRLLGWKGVRLAMAALRRPEASRWHLAVFGDGAERVRLEQLAIGWGISDRVRFLGIRPRAEVREALSQADALLFPSLHDAAGWAVAESLVAGCPVVALRAGGPAVLVCETDGVLVEPSGDVIGGLAAALDRARPLRPSGLRWTAARLPDLVTRIYAEVAAEQVAA